MSDTFSRREIISLIAAVPVGIAALSSVASAADDSGGTKAKFKYQTTPGPGGKKCGACALFQAPSACSVVKGKIAPSGYCISFVPKAK